MSIEEKMDMLRRKIKAGALGADDARRALRAEIDGELRKAAADVDMDAVNACEALLAELSGAKEETHAAQNLRAIREKLHPQRRAPKRSAAGGGARIRRHGDGFGACGQRPHQTA